jgi:hypothetical protein
MVGSGFELSNVAGISISPKPNLNIQACNQTVSLSWNTITEASKYEILSLDLSQGKWKSIGFSNGNRFFVNQLENNIRYGFAVRPWFENSAGMQSNGKIVTPESKLTNGMLWNQYVYQFSVTEEEIAIARAYCPNSEIAINFYDNEKINFYDPYPYGSFNFNIKIFSDKEPISFKIQDQVNIIDLSPLSSYYMWGKISQIYKDTNYGWNIVVSIYGLAGTPPPSINNPNWNNGAGDRFKI